MKKRIFALVFFAFLAGCTTVVHTQGTKIDKDRILGIKAGETTRAEVLSAFGTPTDIVVENNEEKLIYVYKEERVPAYIGGLIESEVQGRESVTSLEVVLKNDIVSSYRFKSSEN